MSRQNNPTNTACFVGPHGLAGCAAATIIIHTGCVSIIIGSSALLQERTVFTRGDETVAPFPELDCPAITQPRKGFLLPVCVVILGPPDRTWARKRIYRSPLSDCSLRRKFRCGGGSGTRRKTFRGIAKKYPIVRRNYFWSGAAVQVEGTLYDRFVGDVTTAAPVFQSCGSHCMLPLPTAFVRKSDAALHNLKFGLVKFGPTSGHDTPATGLRPSYPLTVARVATTDSFSFRYSSFPEPERVTSTVTVPATGFPRFFCSANGASDLSTDAAGSLNSSGCVKLRLSAASVFLSPSPCPVVNLQPHPTGSDGEYRWGTWSGENLWTGGEISRSGELWIFNRMPPRPFIVSTQPGARGRALYGMHRRRLSDGLFLCGFFRRIVEQSGVEELTNRNFVVHTNFEYRHNRRHFTTDFIFMYAQMNIVDKILLCLSMCVPYLTNTLRKFLNEYFVFEISVVIWQNYFFAGFRSMTFPVFRG